MFETKKDQKDLQDLCQRLVEQCAEIAGSQLEQKSLLSRQLTVRPGTQTDPRLNDEAVAGGASTGRSVTEAGA